MRSDGAALSWRPETPPLRLQANPSPNLNPNPNPNQALKAAVAKLGPETPNRWDKVAKG